MNLEEEIQGIKERNAKVEVDKAWEVSATRRITIAVITYGIAYIWPARMTVFGRAGSR